METEHDKFEEFNLESDIHLVLTNRFMEADKLASRGEDPYEVINGDYGEHRYLALESLTIDPPFYLIGQAKTHEGQNITRYLIHKCEKIDKYGLPLNSTREDHVKLTDTIHVGGAEHLVSLLNFIQVTDAYQKAIAEDISKFALVLFWPDWLKTTDWLIRV